MSCRVPCINFCTEKQCGRINGPARSVSRGDETSKKTSSGGQLNQSCQGDLLFLRGSAGAHYSSSLLAM